MNVERCEDRCLTALIFVLNGNGFAAAKPNQLTANAAAVLRQAGNQLSSSQNEAAGALGQIGDSKAAKQREAKPIPAALPRRL